MTAVHNSPPRDRRPFLGLLTSIMTVSATQADVLETAWHVRHPLGGEQFTKCIFASDRFVTVGAGGTILSSPDGKKWMASDKNAGDYIVSVAFGNDTFAAVAADSGNVFLSTNLSTWTVHKTALPRIKDIAFGAGLFVVGGVGGFLATSKDTTNWNTIRIPTQGTITSITAGGRYLIATIGSSTGIRFSQDGINWIPVFDPYYPAGNASCFGGGSFVSVGYYASLVGAPEKDWIRTNLDENYLGVGYGLGSYVAVGASGRMLRSPDAIHWSRVSSGTAKALFSVSSGAGQLVTVGTGSTILRSDDGISWKHANEGIFATVRSIESHGDLIVTAGGTPGSEGFILTSQDGTNWVKSGFFDGRTLHDVGYGKSWIVVGEKGTIAESSDGLNWAETKVGGDDLFGVYADEHTSVAVGQNAAIHSHATEGGWIPHRVAAGGTLRSIAHAAGRWVLVGDGGLVLCGDSLDTLTEVPRFTSAGLHDTAFVNGFFVAAGEHGTLCTSTNGTLWTLRESGVIEDLSSVASGEGRIIVAGSAGRLITSTLGISWQVHELRGETMDLFGICYARESFFAVGERGSILQSRRVPLTISIRRAFDISAPLSPRHPPTLVITGGIGKRYRVEVATALDDWQLLSETDGRDFVEDWYVADSQATNRTRLYRALTRE